MVSAPQRVDPANVQGWVAKGYNTKYVRQALFEITDAKAARRLLDLISGGDPSLPQVTSGARWTTKPDHMLNVGLTFEGLKALDVPDRHLRSFPTDYRQGAAARAAKIGDVGDSDPARWHDGFADPARVHGVLSIHSDTQELLERVTAQLTDAAGGAVRVRQSFDGEGFYDVRDGKEVPNGRVHFGYRDGISQPTVEGLREDAIPDGQPMVPTGAFVLGYPSQFENVVFTVPQPDDLGRDGSYNAFRVLKQDVFAFHQFVADSAQELGLDQDLVMAKLCGRWPNGNPLALQPLEPGETLPPDKINDYGFADDPLGDKCPLGSHMRRANPRDGKIVQHGFGSGRRIIRRGMPYGPEYIPGDGRAVDDGIERGLLGNFICASLSAVFEALQYDWINLGLQHPDITGLNDPLLGANDPNFSKFEFTGPQGPCVVRGFNRFVITRGCAYTFIPSMRALRWLAQA